MLREMTVKMFCSVALVGVGGFLATAQAAPIKVACVGPQHVHSHQLDYPQEYPAMLGKLLGPAYEVGNFGDCCATVLQGYKRQRETHPYLEGGESYPAVGGKNFKDSVKFMPDIVVIGPWGKHDTEIANSVYGGMLDRAKLEADYEQLIRTYLDLPSKPKVFVMPVIPIPFGMPVGVATTVMQPAFLAVAAKLPVTVVDVYPAFLNKRALFKDATHISNDTGLKLMTDMVAAAIQAAPANDAGTAPVADASSQDAPGTGGVEGVGGALAGTGGISGTGGSGTGGSGTGGSVAATGGVGGQGGASGMGGASAPSPGGDAPTPSACAYRGPGSATGWPAALVMVATLLLARRRRR